METQAAADRLKGFLRLRIRSLTALGSGQPGKCSSGAMEYNEVYNFAKFLVRNVQSQSNAAVPESIDTLCSNIRQSSNHQYVTGFFRIAKKRASALQRGFLNSNNFDFLFLAEWLAVVSNPVYLLHPDPCPFY